ncbi:hypothetical protein SBA2_650005 [Acidobacteriia bacterium SbA2]|nr:hypothetical protein SBA2_650005 [Acidobacteriia bacterium SbA2]
MLLLQFKSADENEVSGDGEGAGVPKSLQNYARWLLPCQCPSNGMCK